ncbi:MAG: 3'-5' exonuclease [Firmicutes bacterium]|nr:3'-5' exonuclease [Bacillota bacterium]
MKKMLLIDLETRSFPVESGIYEVACLAIVDYEIVDSLHLANAIDGYFAPRSYGYGYHNISQNDKYITRFRDFISKYPYPLVAHNCPFDKKFLLHYEWVSEDYLFYCSMRAIRRHDGSLKSYAMDELVRHFKIAEETDHQAMSDVENLYKLLAKIRPREWIPVGVDAPRRRRPRKKAVTKLRGRRKTPKPRPRPRALEDIDLPIPSTEVLTGEGVCFTGKSDYPRHTMQEIALKNGAQITNSITSKTTLLVVGVNAGSKLDKAQKRDISIVSDKDFMEMIGLSSNPEEKASEL